jgi:hypothetical protein
MYFFYDRYKTAAIYFISFIEITDTRNVLARKSLRGSIKNRTCTVNECYYNARIRFDGVRTFSTLGDFDVHEPIVSVVRFTLRPFCRDVALPETVCYFGTRWLHTSARQLSLAPETQLGSIQRTIVGER